MQIEFTLLLCKQNLYNLKNWENRLKTRRKRKSWDKKVEDNMSENFLSLMNDLNLHIQELEQNLSGIASKKSILRYIEISLWKLNMKKKIWKQSERNDTLPINWTELQF